MHMQRGQRHYKYYDSEPRQMLQSVDVFCLCVGASMPLWAFIYAFIYVFMYLFMSLYEIYTGLYEKSDGEVLKARGADVSGPD